MQPESWVTTIFPNGNLKLVFCHIFWQWICFCDIFQPFYWNVSWILIVCGFLCWNVLCVSCLPKTGCLFKNPECLFGPLWGTVGEFPAVLGLCGKVLIVEGCRIRSWNSQPVLGKFTFAVLTLEIMNVTLPVLLLAPLKSSNSKILIQGFTWTFLKIFFISLIFVPEI